jgi:hypothetical protein
LTGALDLGILSKCSATVLLLLGKPVLNYWHFLSTRASRSGLTGP